MVQELLTEGTGELPKGKEAGRERGAWPYVEKVNRDLEKWMASLPSSLRQEGL